MHALATRPRWFFRWPRLAALLFGCSFVLAAFTACELGLRAFGPAWLRERMAVMAFRGPSSIGGDSPDVVVMRGGEPLAYRPSARFSLVHPEYATLVRIDELGGRRVRGSPDTKDFLPFFGDSFTFGLGVDDDATFVAQLQASFRQRLLNLGMLGASLPHYRFAIGERHVELGRPRVYVIALYLGNDLNDVMRHYASGERTPRAGARRQRASGFFFSRLNYAIEFSPLGGLYTLHYAKHVMLPFINRGRPEPMQDPIFPLMGGDPAYAERAYRLFDRDLSQLDALRQQLGFVPVFVLLPDVQQLLSEQRALKADYYGLVPARLDPGAPNRRVAALLRAHGLSVLDPTPAMAAAADRKAFYYRYDNHLTQAGHTFLARWLAARLPALIASLATPAGRTP